MRGRNARERDVIALIADEFICDFPCAQKITRVFIFISRISREIFSRFVWAIVCRISCPRLTELTEIKRWDNEMRETNDYFIAIKLIDLNRLMSADIRHGYESIANYAEFYRKSLVSLNWPIRYRVSRIIRLIYFSIRAQREFDWKLTFDSLSALYEFYMHWPLIIVLIKMQRATAVADTSPLFLSLFIADKSGILWADN